MKLHNYNGEKFKVQTGLSRVAADSFCRQLVAARDTRQNPGDDRFEVDRMPDDYRDSQTPRKGRGRPRKVIASIPVQNPVGGDTDTPESMRPGFDVGAIADEATISESETRYAQGFYREVCKQCREPIQRTGKRGRAPIYHDSCRPKEGE